jgi:hypothetical protein
VLDEVPAINDDAADAALTVDDGSIEFRNVTFSYADSGKIPRSRTSTFDSLR